MALLYETSYTASTTISYIYILVKTIKREKRKKKKRLKYITSFPTFWSFTFDLTEQFSFHFSFLCIVGENENRFFFVLFPYIQEMMSVSWDVLLFSITIFIHHLMHHIL